MHRIDGPGATVDKKFTEEVPAQGIPATDVTDDWLNAVQEEIAAVIEGAGIILDKAINTQLLQAIQSVGPMGLPVTLAVETTLATPHGLVFANPAEGATVLFHLPIYAAVSPYKRYRFKNIGLGLARLDTTDGKTIDGESILDLLPGDRCELAKDGTNWQTI